MMLTSELIHISRRPMKFSSFMGITVPLRWASSSLSVLRSVAPSVVQIIQPPQPFVPVASTCFYWDNHFDQGYQIYRIAGFVQLFTSTMAARRYESKLSIYERVCGELGALEIPEGGEFPFIWPINTSSTVPSTQLCVFIGILI